MVAEDDPNPWEALDRDLAALKDASESREEALSKLDVENVRKRDRDISQTLSTLRGAIELLDLRHPRDRRIEHTRDLLNTQRTPPVSSELKIIITRLEGLVEARKLIESAPQGQDKEPISTQEVRRQRSEAAPAPQPPLLDLSRWEDLIIRFLTPETVELSMGEQKLTRSYDELGFRDHRCRHQRGENRAWRVLHELAQSAGEITHPENPGEGWDKVERRIMEIRAAFHKLFGLPSDSDPLPFVKRGGYCANFRIECSPECRALHSDDNVAVKHHPKKPRVK